MSFLKSAIQQTLAINSAASTVSGGEMSNVKIDTEKGNDVVLAKGDYNQVVNESGDDNIILSGDFNDVLAESGNNLIAVNGSNNNVAAMNGNNNIYAIGDYNEIGAMNGDNTITSKGDWNTVVAAFGDNNIYSEGDMNLIQTEAGDQVIESHGDGNLINAGQGNHDIFFTGDSNDLVFGDGDTNLIFWGDDNRIKGGEGDHDIRTLDWVIEQNPESYYANYSDLIDDYAVKTEEKQVKGVSEITKESDWVEVNESIGEGSQEYKDYTGEYVVTEALETAELVAALSDEEKSAISTLDFSETYNDSPRYVFAYGSQDQQVHVYDVSTGKAVIELSGADNDIPDKSNSMVKINKDGVATTITKSYEVESDIRTSGKYSDLADKGEEVFAQEIYKGTLTTNLVSTTYDFSKMSNQISVGNGNNTIYVSGSTPVLNYGKMTGCDCHTEETDSTISQRDAVQTNYFESILSDLTIDYLYRIGGEIPKSSKITETETTTETQTTVEESSETSNS